MKGYHTIVAGLGAMGSAALYHLSAGGKKVAGFDRFSPPHTMGSSHGETRMIREAYYEHPAYVPLVQRAYELWHQLAVAAREPMIHETGGVFAGPPHGELVPGMKRAAREHGIPVEALTHARASVEFPAFHFDTNWEIVREPRAGFVYPERCIQTQLKLAEQCGAELHMEEPVLSWTADRGGVVVRTDRWEHRAERLVLATGAWMVDTLSSVGVRAAIERQPLMWFGPRRGATPPGTVWALEFERGKLLYGFPATDTGVKVAIHYGGAQVASPLDLDRTLHESDVQRLRHATDTYLPDVLGERVRSEVCMYTNTPDLHFVFDPHPRHDNVLLVSACSGHGFKFSSAIGEAAAQWAMQGTPRADMSYFSLRRLRK